MYNKCLIEKLHQIVLESVAVYLVFFPTDSVNNVERNMKYR